jgi:hypothetical protein
MHMAPMDPNMDVQGDTDDDDDTDEENEEELDDNDDDDIDELDVMHLPEEGTCLLRTCAGRRGQFGPTR